MRKCSCDIHVIFLMNLCEQDEITISSAGMSETNSSIEHSGTSNDDQLISNSQPRSQDEYKSWNVKSDDEDIDEEYDIEQMINTDAASHNSGIPSEQERIKDTDFIDSPASENNDDIDQLDCVDEQVTDVNRVNLMMLLSTLSVVNDNNPNDPYNINSSRYYDNHDDEGAMKIKDYQSEQSQIGDDDEGNKYV